MAAPTRIFIVEDHPIYRAGLVHFLDDRPEFELSGEAEDSGTALADIERTQPHVVLVDLQLKDSSGFSLVRDIRARWPDIKIIVVSMYEEMRYADRLLAAGVHGYVMKDKGPATVLRAIQSALSGQPYASERVSRRMLRRAAHPDHTRSLTDREIEIFQLVGEGNKVRQIAEMLHLSSKTVQNHIHHIQSKLDVDSRQAFYQAARDFVQGRET